MKSSNIKSNAQKSRSSSSRSSIGTKSTASSPTSPSQFILVFFYSIFRRVVCMEPLTRAGAYLVIAAAASLFFDFVPAPPSYFSRKHNLFNKVFIKFGWGITVLSLAYFILISSYIISGKRMSIIRSHLARLVVGSSFWYICTGFFMIIENKTGQCFPTNITTTELRRPSSRFSCQKLGGVWLGFDISGHCFLLCLCNLFITEELHVMFHWQKLSDILKPFEKNFSPQPSDGVSYIKLNRFNEEEISAMRLGFKRLTGTLKVSFIFTAFLSVLWDIMFCSTIVYFHNMPTKLLGTAFAVSSWFISYRCIFRNFKPGDWFGFAPCYPGATPLDFMPKS